MKKSTSIITLVVLAALIAGISLYQQKEKGPSPSSPADKALKIGVITIGSGEYAGAGENFRKGIQLALDEHRLSHPEKQIELTVEDDEFNAAKGLSAYKKLSTLDRIDALINLSTPTIGSIYDQTKVDGLPVMQGGVQVANATADNVFQVSPDGDKALTAYAKYISSNYQFKNIAVIRDNTDYHIGFSEGFKEGLPANYPFIEYVNESKDVRTLAAKIISGKHDAVVLIMNVETGALLSKELLIHGISPSILFYDVQLNTGSAEYAKILGSLNKLDGAKVLTLKQGDSISFNARYKEKFGTDAGFFSEYGYDAFVALIGAEARTNEQWVKNLESTNIQGAASRITFDKNGVRNAGTEVNVVREGKITVLKESIEL